MADLQDQIKIGVDASGVETGVGRVKRSMADMGKSVSDAGKRGADGLKEFGRGGEAAAVGLDSATKRMVSSLQRQVAAAEAGGTATRAYQESIARLRGANLDVLRPYLDQLDEANRKTEEVRNKTEAMVGAFRGIGSKLVGIASGVAAAFSLREFISTADALTSLNNQLKLATGSAESAKTAYTALFEIAQRSRVSFVELGTTYASIARSTGEMGISQQRLLKVTESIGNAMTISGGSAQSMQAALVQLSQGFASGALRGDELNSVMEQTPRLAKAIADGLGVSIGKLREMGKEGQITAESVVKALESQSDALRTEVAGATLTVGQAFTQLGNASTRATGEFDAATGASATFASAISSVASAMDGLGASFRENETTINTVMGALGGTAAVASLRLLPAAIGAVGAAVTGLAAILAANPVTLALLGVGAVVGGAVSYARAEAKTAEGIQRSIDALRLENERSEAAMQRAAAGGRTAGADTIRKTIDDRTAAIAKLREELGKLQSSSVAGAGAGRGTISPPTIAEMERQQSANSAARTKAINDLLGVSQKYQDKLTELQGLQKSGVLTSAEYAQAVSKLATETWAATDAGKAAAEASKAGTKARDEAAKAAQREAESYGSFISSVQSKIAAIDLEIAGGSKLTESQKLQLRMEKQIADGKMNASRAAQEATKASLAELSAKEAALKLQTEQNKAMEEGAKAYDAYVKTQQQQAVASAEKNDAMRLEIEAMGLSKRELLNLNRSRLDEQIVVLQAKHSQLTLAGARDDETKAIRDQIKALEERKNLLGQQFDKQAMLDAQQEITDTWVSIDRTAHDTFVNIFEDGAGTFKRLGQTLKAALLDMLYQMTVKRWIINIGASMGATGGMFSAGNAVAGQGGSALGLMGNANSLFSGAGLVSNWLGTGAGAGMGTLAYGNAIGALGGDGLGAFMAANGGWGTSGAGALGSSFASALPWVGGALLVANALGLFRSLERKGGGLIGTLGQAGGVHDVDLMRRGGTLFSGPDWFTEDKGVSALDRAIQQQFTASKDAIKGFAETLGLSTDKIDGFTTALGTATMGDHGQLGIRLDKDGKPLSDQEIQAAIAEAIKAGSNELAQQLIGTWTESIEQVTRTVVGTTGGAGDGWDVRQVTEDRTTRTYTPSEFARDGEQAIDTLTRLATSLQGVNAMFDTLGLTLYEASLKGGDMASQLADDAGGLDKLQTTTASYFQNFYSGSEQHATALRQLQEQMTRMGVETIPYTREQFRALVESLDLTTEEGRKMYAGLLAISEAFAAVTPQLFQGGQTLSDAITQGLLGTYDGANLGAYMAQTVTDGIYNAVAGQFANQITDIMLQGVINPMIQAAVTGSSVSAAVSQASIDAMVAQANAVASAAAAVMNDPAFRAAMASISQAIASIQIPAVRASSSVSTYTAAVRDSGGAADRAASEVNRLSDAWKSIGDSLMDEVNRIRGVMNETAGQGVDYWQAQFAIAKAQAMAGDQDAAKSLAGISQNLLRAGEESAGSLLELQRLRAQVAQSLQDTAGYAYGRAGALPAPPQPEATTGGNMWAGIGVGGMFTVPPFTAPITPPTMSAPMAWTAPPPVYTAQPGASGRDPELLAEVKALRAAIESNARTDNDLQRRGVRVLERMDTLGMPKERVETTA